MKFGGFTQFGGAAKFGGGVSMAQKYWNIFRTEGISPPGVYDLNEDTLRNQLLLTDAKGIGDRGKRHIEGIEGNIFPDTAFETLEEWETMLGIVVPDGATIASRQAAALSRWQLAKPSSLTGLRQILYPVLNPTTAFWDRFDDEDVSARFIQQTGAGTITEQSTGLRLQCTGTVDCDWTGSINLAPRVLLQIPDRNDGWKVYLDIASMTTGTATGFGIAAIDVKTNPRNAIRWGSQEFLGSDYYQLQTLIDGTYTANAYTSATTVIATDWIILEKVGNVYKCYSKTDTGNEMLEYQTIANFTPRYWAIFGKNLTASKNALDVTFDNFKVEMATGYNNVEIVERPLSVIDDPDNDDTKFFAFVHREPTDPGDYDISESQRTADLASQAHTVITVGESDCFKCNDPYSLTNRDIIGS